MRKNAVLAGGDMGTPRAFAASAVRRELLPPLLSRRPLPRSQTLLRIFVLILAALALLYVLPRRHAVLRRPFCPAEIPPEAAATTPTGPWTPATVSLHSYDFEWLRRHHGEHTVYAASSSRLQEDQTDAGRGGLPEAPMRFAGFLDAIRTGARPTHDYVKMLDRTVLMGVDGVYAESFRVLGHIIETELRAALVQAGIWHPQSLSWSLWIGAKGSATAMHVDDHAFNVLYVVRGLKRLVLVDDTHPFECTEPEQSPTACWVERDILAAPPPYAREVVIGTGQAFVLPPAHWHAVENLEPTIAFGVNEDTDCSLRRYARLTGPYTGFRL